ncbi:hypothetical protein [Acetobacter oryzifermentans]|uniref:hypothetical protein n=1 Tax=Acetobacter oryzifermentans TaxID=1633874 RepID=UPI00197CB7F5|nr:hypothetical protein [Acetobacter oryzifermentans]
MVMAACIIHTGIQAMAPYMMIIMVMAVGAVVAEARGLAQVLVPVADPVGMVAPVALALAHAQAVVVVAHQVVALAVPVAVVALVVVTDNLAKAAFFKV